MCMLYVHYNLHLIRQLLTANLRAEMQLTRYDLRHCRMVTYKLNFFPNFSEAKRTTCIKSRVMSLEELTIKEVPDDQVEAP